MVRPPAVIYAMNMSSPHIQSDTHRAAARLAARRFIFVPVLCLDAVKCPELLHGRQALHGSLHAFHHTKLI